MFLNNFPYVQSGLNIGFSIVQIGFLLYYRPFKETAILFSNISGDLSVLIVFVACTAFLGDISISTSKTIEMILFIL